MQNVHRPVKTYVDYPAPIVWPRCQKQLVVDHGCAVDEDVDAAEPRMDHFRQVRHVRGRRNVGLQSEGLDADLGSKACGRCLGQIAIEIDNDDAVALGGKHARRCKPDAAGTACDNSDSLCRGSIHSCLTLLTNSITGHGPYVAALPILMSCPLMRKLPTMGARRFKARRRGPCSSRP